jgi:hypothetical protein
MMGEEADRRDVTVSKHPVHESIQIHGLRPTSGQHQAWTTHNELSYTAPLIAITAAIVGVILYLGLFSGNHVLWPLGLHGPFE